MSRAGGDQADYALSLRIRMSGPPSNLFLDGNLSPRWLRNMT